MSSHDTSSPSPNAAYEHLKERYARMIKLGFTVGILSKDMETAMAEGSGNDRVEQIVALSETMHEMIADPKVACWLDEAEEEQDRISSDDRRNLALMRRSWVHEASLSQELASEISRLESEGQRLHTKYKKSGDWDKMKDWYVHSFKTMRHVAKMKQEALGMDTPYEALLDQFNTDVDEKEISQTFDSLAKKLKELLAAALDKQEQEGAPIPLSGTFPQAQQEILCRRLAEDIGFDFNRGRLDFIDGHPSSGGSPDDSRITAGCDEKNFLDAVSSTVHEAGHGMYEQGLPVDWRYQPAGRSMGMNIHETQSMVIEKAACKIPEFFSYLEHLAREIFDRPDDPALSADNMRRLVDRAHPSHIRVDADDLTYPAHVILRFEIERAIINGEEEPENIPSLWNDKMKELLGVVPDNPSQGHMQDVHWPTGAIGYFPAYTLGAMGAAQFFHAACRDKPEIRPQIAKGNFAPLKDWLNEKIHSQGSFLTTDALYESATGETLDERFLIELLKQRFL